MKRRRVRRPRVASVPWRALRSVVKVYPVRLDPLEDLLALVQRVNDKRCPPGLREICAILANAGALDDGARASWRATLRRHTRIMVDESGTLRVELTSPRGLDALTILMLDAADRTRHTLRQCAVPDCPRFFLVQRRRGRSGRLFCDDTRHRSARAAARRAILRVRDRGGDPRPHPLVPCMT